MKVLAFLLSIIVSVGLMFGGIFLIVVQSPQHSIGVQLLAIFSLTVMIYGPVTLGSMHAYWKVNATEESRGYYKRWLWVVLGLEVLASVAIIAFAVLAGSPPWLPVLFIVAEVVLMWLGLLVGGWLRRHDEAHPQPLKWTPVSRDEILRKIAIVAVTFVAVFILAFVVLGWVGSGNNAMPLVVQLLYAVAFAAMAASLACIICTLPLNSRLRDAAGRDMDTMRKVGKVVLGNKKIGLDKNEQIAAAKYAVVVPATLGFMTSYLILLYIGLGIQQVVRLVSGQVDAFTIGMLTVLILVLAFSFPYFVIRIRRASSYARNHVDLLPATDAPTAQGLDPA